MSAHTGAVAIEQNQGIATAIRAERSRLRRFIRRHGIDPIETEDVLQDVFSELVDAYRLLKPIEQVGAWLMRVARNRIIDRFRRRREASLPDLAVDDEGELVAWDELLPADDSGPEVALMRTLLLEEIEVAVAELPAMQREVFIAHEFEGRSFKEIAGETGVSVNTLLSRKHAAVESLRKRLRQAYEELQSFGGT